MLDDEPKGICTEETKHLPNNSYFTRSRLGGSLEDSSQGEDDIQWIDNQSKVLMPYRRNFQTLKY